MQFNKLINSLLREELSDREKRIQALKGASMSNLTKETEEYYEELESIFTDGRDDTIESWQMEAVRELFNRVREELGETAVKALKDEFIMDTENFINGESSQDMIRNYRFQIDFIESVCNDETNV